MDKIKFLSKLPLVELVGQNRVLIENHLGVIGYALEEIQIKVNFGLLSVTGSDLKLAQMDSMQLVITGEIDSVHLFRG